ncbi:phage tail-collar fiber domain-containing protein [Pseudomonas hormoni]
MVNQNSIFGGMLTTQGAAKKTNCDALGIPWEPRYMLIGDANGADPVPSPSQTKLVNQVYRAQLNQLRVSPTDANILIAELVLPPDVGGWWIRELALEDKDGVFCAVANAAPSYKPLLAQGSGRNQVVRMHIITSGTSNIQLKIDPSVVLATRQYVDETVNGLLPANKPAGTYTKVTVNDRGVFVSGSNPTTLAGFGIKDTYTKAEIESIIAQASALPVGAMVAFPKATVPPGFLEIDGSVQSIATYPDLAAYLGTAFNQGNEGAGNFRLPESRGEFLRGWDHGRGVDVGRAMGSYQLDQFKSHTHDYDNMQGGGTPNSVSDTVAAMGDSSAQSGHVTGASGGVETRPRNLAVMWCLKAWNAPINQGQVDVGELVKEVQKLKSAVPVGALVPFPTGVVPPGYLEADNSVFVDTAYPELAAYLDKKYNIAGDPVGSTRLPETRGEFLRGWDHGRGVDAGRTVGSTQKGSLVALDTGVIGVQSVHFTGSASVANAQQASGLDAYLLADYPNLDISGVSGYSTALPGLAAETASGVVRPRNLAVMWCIKAWNAPINQGTIDVAALALEVQTFNSKLGQMFKNISNVTPSRAINVEYTNVSGRLMYINVGLASTAANQTASILIDGKSFFGSSQPASGLSLTVSAPVPAGSTYKLPPGSYTLSSFLECT